MDRREARRIAIHRAGLIIDAVLSDGWQPDDLIEREGQEAFEMINDELTKIAESMINGGRVPQPPVTPHASESAPASTLGAALEEFVRQLNSKPKITACTHPDAVVTRVPATDDRPPYWSRRCDHCGAQAQGLHWPPAMMPTLMFPERPGDTAAPIEDQKESTP